MLGNLTGEATAELLSDITIDKIDFEWVEQAKKISHLKKALRLLEEDGDYFPDLKKAVEKRIIEIDPTQAPRNFNNIVDMETKQELQKDVYNWEDSQHKRDEQREQKKKQQVFEVENDDDIEIEEVNKRKAENEKNKGNEAVKSKDFEEALQYYSKSIEYNPKLAPSYCNRALVYLKLKNYDECIKDCNRAIGLDSNYIKAYHRRGKANQALKNYNEAYNDFRFIMDRQPENSEVNADLQDVIKTMKKEEKNKGLKRVQIVEEDDEDEDEEEEEEEEENNEECDPNAVSQKEFEQRIKRIEDNKEKATKLMKDGMFEEAVKILEKCVNDVEEMGPHNKDKNSLEFQTKRCSYLNNMALCFKQTDHNKDVIKLTSKVIQQRNILDKNILIKAFLRRAMSLEKIEKFRSAKIDYQSVKTLDPGNLQASQGLSRTIPHQGEEPEDKIIQIEEIKEDKLRQEKEEKLQQKQNEVEIQEENQEKEQTQQEQQPEQQQQEQKQEEKQKVEETPVVVEKKKEVTSLEDLEKKKAEANGVFKKKNIEEALKLFNEGVQIFETQYKKVIKREGEEAQKLYIQFMTNKALCELRLEKFENVVKTTDKVLNLEPNNAKAIYRNALGTRHIGEQILKEEGDNISLENLKRVSSYLEGSRKELERLQKIEKSNTQLAHELQEVVKKSVQIKLRVREKDSEQQQKKQDQQKSDKKQQQQQEQQEKIVEQVEEKQVEPTINKEFINEVSRSAMCHIIEGLIDPNTLLPDNCTTFEKNLTSFKKQPEKLFLYLQKFQEQDLVSIYSKRDIPPDNLMQIVRSLKNEGIQLNSGKCKELMGALSKTNKFNLCVMCLSKKEKAEIKEVLDKVEAEKELYSVYKL